MWVTHIGKCHRHYDNVTKPKFNEKGEYLISVRNRCWELKFHRNSKKMNQVQTASNNKINFKRDSNSELPFFSFRANPNEISRKDKNINFRKNFNVFKNFLQFWWFLWWVHTLKRYIIYRIPIYRILVYNGPFYMEFYGVLRAKSKVFYLRFLEI